MSNVCFLTNHAPLNHAFYSVVNKVWAITAGLKKQLEEKIHM